MRATVVVGLGLGLAACWSEAPVTLPTTPSEPLSSPATLTPDGRTGAYVQPSRDPTRTHAPLAALPRLPTKTTWHGVYLCSQGETDVTLTLEWAGAEAEAVFAFGPTTNNARPLTGATRLRGSFVELGDGSFAVDLDPLEWVTQPPGYVMVGMTGTIDAAMQKLVGRMKSSNCGGIDVDRVR
ncbi:MAG: hypothetical protein NT062_12980 [Proteobacteria bacterium]|nr:hypothetical protein [Pseudomonadota bacterium]